MCLDDQILNTYLDGELTEPWKTQVEEHLSYCTACKKRHEQLDQIHHLVSQSKLEDDQIESHKERVLQYIEKNVIGDEKKVSFWHRDFKLKTPILLSTAAAFVFILVGALFIGRGIQQDSNQIIPTLLPSSEGSVVQVKATDALAADQILENFTLEEILKYLDSKGYDVDLKLRTIKSFSEEM
ncbi:MAG: anti-sigma factor family protein [Sphaerochaetaceae bacterium]|jgi:hypothetical protein